VLGSSLFFPRGMSDVIDLALQLPVKLPEFVSVVFALDQLFCDCFSEVFSDGRILKVQMDDSTG
jgi:hypothetical protein